MIKDFKNLMRSNLLLLFPWLLIVIAGIILIPYTKLYVKEIIGFGLFTCVFIAIGTLIKWNNLHKTRYIISYLILATFALIKLGFYSIYDVQLSASSLYVIFETNTQEASEYASSSINKTTFALLLILVVPLLYFFLKSKNNFYIKWNSKFTRVLLFLGFIASLGVIKWKFEKENIPLMSMYAYGEYKKTKELIKSQLGKKNSSYFKNILSQEDPQTYIIILGESTSRRHMSLYGYNRLTNPKLSKIKNDLVVFDSVIAPNVHTITSLDKILTFSKYNEPNKENNASIVQMANEAGFKTYWVSNQRPVGLHESIPTLIGSAAHKTYFTATDDYNNVNYDEKVLPVLDAVFKENEKKKMIFIHLIGTHIDYKMRYPSSFNYFRDMPVKRPFNHDIAVQKTNEYDNAVRYNDSIVATIINKAKGLTEKSMVCYFSDHGDDVYDELDMATHNEYHGTRPMYEVPLIFWFSKKYKEDTDFNSKINSYKSRKYNLEDFIHTFASISKITYEGFDTTRSIIDSSFIERPRIVNKGVNYDKK